MRRVVILAVTFSFLVFPFGCETKTPNGGTKNWASIPRNDWPRYVNANDVAATWDTGPFTSDLNVTIRNTTQEQLQDMKLTFTFYPEQGNPLERPAFLGLISQGNSQSVKVNVPSGRYAKVEVKGVALGHYSRNLLAGPNSGRYHINKSFYYK